ncbi:MAG: hypothetical protein R2757_13890 [Draconibacterium sp.]
MKSTKLPFVGLYIIVFLFFGCHQKIKYTDYQYLIENPNGKIKSLKISCFNAEDKFGEVIRDYPEEIDMFFENYNFTFNLNIYNTNIYNSQKNEYLIFLNYDKKEGLLKRQDMIEMKRYWKKEF